MRVKKFFLFAVFFVVFASFLRAADYVVGILPYVNIAEKGAYEYLRYYIPKVLSKALDLDRSLYKVVVIKKNDTFFKEVISSNNVPSREVIFDIMNRSPYDYLIVGSYIIEGNQIRIYTDVYIKIGNQKKTLVPFIDTNISNRLLDVIDSYCEEKSNAFRQYVLYIEGKRLQRTYGFLDIMFWKNIAKSIGVGFIFSSRYSVSLLVVLFFILFAFVINRIGFKLVLNKLASSTDTQIDDLIIEGVAKPFTKLIIAIGFRIAIMYLPLGERGFLIAKGIINSVIIWEFAVIIWNVAKVLIREWGEKAAKETETSLDDLMPLIYEVARILVFTLGALLIMSQFGIEVGPFIASLGIAGFAIGFAVKDVLGNIFGGVSLILDKTFRLGDKVQIEGFETGYVEEVGIRTTKIRTFSGELVVIPNGVLVNKSFKNYGLPERNIRVEVYFSVAYGEDVDRVRYVVLETIKNIPDCLEDPAPSVEFIEMGDFSLNFVAKFWVEDFKLQYDNKLLATQKIYEALNKAGIEIPFPTHTVYIREENSDKSNKG